MRLRILVCQLFVCFKGRLFCLWLNDESIFAVFPMTWISSVNFFAEVFISETWTGLIYLGSLNPIPFGGMASWVWRWRFVGYLVVKKFNNCIHRTNLSVNHHYSNGVMFKQFLIKAYVFFSQFDVAFQVYCETSVICNRIWGVGSMPYLFEVSKRLQFDICSEVFPF